MKRFHSIRTRITVLTIAAILISTLLVGIISIITVKGESESRSAQTMSLICEAKAEEINSFLSGIDDSIETVSRYAYENLDVIPLADGGVIGATGSGRSLRNRERTAGQQEALDEYLREHVAKVSTVFRTIAENNAIVISYYYRINPELSKNVQGFWYSSEGSPDFQQLEPTDISEYAVDDFAHVGWFYLPLERGRPSWIEPYENANLEDQLVSCVAPIYKNGTFIGVVGIDIKYTSLVDLISGLEVLDTGYAFLTDSKGKIVYHPELENGVLLRDVNSELDETDDYANGAEMISYTFDGVKKTAARSTLSNDLRLIVAAPDSEINSGWHSLALFIILASVLVLALFIILTTSLMRRITNPLVNLAKASEELSAGNYDVELTYEGDDEVGTLTRSFKQMATHLQVFINDLNSKAYRDALTGVRNKGAFDIFTFKLDEKIKQSPKDERPEFAVAMFDCNDLKPVNDNYGHEKGDIYLQTACRIICKVYAHSPVFRIGGDEFAAILQESDYHAREKLERAFEEMIDEVNAAAENDWERASIASGLAAYDPAIDRDLESVLRRADEMMYEHKKRYKESRGEDAEPR